MALKCMVCSTSCVSCAWWKCRWCWFNSEQVTFSNEIINEYVVDFAIPWLVDTYRILIKEAKEKEYTKQDILEKLSEHVPTPIVEKPKPDENVSNPSSMLCEYEPWALWAWDRCKLCGEPRFYQQNKSCSYKLNKKDEL